MSAGANLYSETVKRVPRLDINNYTPDGVVMGAFGASNLKYNPPATGVSVTPEGPYVNLASGDRTIHILYGDKTGGGHMWPGMPGKTPFPENWSAPKVMHEVSDIASDPTLRAVRPDGKTDLFYKSGKPARFVVEGVREGVTIKVVVEPAGEGIITAHVK